MEGEQPCLRQCFRPRLRLSQQRSCKQSLASGSKPVLQLNNGFWGRPKSVLRWRKESFEHSEEGTRCCYSATAAVRPMRSILRRSSWEGSTWTDQLCLHKPSP